jgi:hypothetical protein
MKVLVYGNRKQPDVIYDISTPEKEEAAFWALFKMLDEDWQVYSELETVQPVARGVVSSRRNHWAGLYRRAKAGECAAMKQLMKDRSDRHHEYEEFHFAEVKDATAG